MINISLGLRYLAIIAPNGAANTPPINRPSVGPSKSVKPRLKMNALEIATVRKNSALLTVPITLRGSDKRQIGENTWLDNVTIDIADQKYPADPANNPRYHQFGKQPEIDIAMIEVAQPGCRGRETFRDMHPRRGLGRRNAH